MGHDPRVNIKMKKIQIKEGWTRKRKITTRPLGTASGEKCKIAAST